MLKPRNLLFYLGVLLVFGAGILYILDYGSHLEPAAAAAAGAAASPAKAGAPAASGGTVVHGLLGNLHHPLSLLLLQVLVIVVAARSLGVLFRKMGQPPVIGEMVAGILLGPSLLGWVAPAAQQFVFPSDSLEPLRLLSQIGVILFMFIVGIELNLEHLRSKVNAAVMVSHASIVLPFFFGTAVALLLYGPLAPAGVPFSAFALFIGVSMSITAFPVLARILEERGIARTHLGTTAIACAAVDDLTAWCLLAVVVAIVQAGGVGGSLWTIGMSLLFILLMLFVVRPRLARIAERRAITGTGSSSSGLLAALFALVFASALATEVIGIHALFGAFLAGVCMPPSRELRHFLRERLETFSSAFLLPLFFAFTGLRTQIGLLNDWQGWLMCFGIIAVAIAGKLGGSMTAARWTGMSWGDSFSLGALMNTRGLVELIVLNIGFDLGILSPRIFAMLVLMALVTTFMTGPLVALVEWLRHRETDLASQPEVVT
ncbi:MAG TPA: cation:proton antiporter [Thermoanaerobaculia bacterium]|nr:cation:proton antiporter [Thermoanaerobaculia bacterium]